MSSGVTALRRFRSPKVCKSKIKGSTFYVAVSYVFLLIVRCFCWSFCVVFPQAMYQSVLHPNPQTNMARPIVHQSLRQLVSLAVITLAETHSFKSLSDLNRYCIYQYKFPRKHISLVCLSVIFLKGNTCYNCSNFFVLIFEEFYINST